MWRNKKAECEEELKKILQVEELDPSAPAYFQQRLAAAKIVMDRLTIAEIQAVDAEVRKIRETGHRPEQQQRYVGDQIVCSLLITYPSVQTCR